MKLQYLLIIVLLSNNFVNSQSIYIGQNSNEVLTLLESKANERIGYDSYGNSRGNNLMIDKKYIGKELSEVIICWKNQLVYDYDNAILSYCERYIMEKGVYKYKLTQFENKTSYDLHYLIARQHYKINDYYFTRDFEFVQEVIYDKEGNPLVKSGKASNYKFSDFELSEIERWKIKIKNYDEEKAKAELKENESESPSSNEVDDFKIFIKENYPKAKITSSGLAYIADIENEKDILKDGEYISFYCVIQVEDTKEIVYQTNEFINKKSPPDVINIGHTNLINGNKGMVEGLRFLKLNSKVLLIIPYWLAYGKKRYSKIVGERKTILCSIEKEENIETK